MTIIRLLFVSILLFALTGLSFAQENTITVIGNGTAHASADRAELMLTVGSQDQTATAVFVKQDDIVKRLEKTLANNGIAMSNIHEQSYRLMPNYEYGQQGTRVIGYRMETPISVVVEDVTIIPHLVDVAVAGGASAVTIGTFQSTHISEMKEEAEHAALDDARNQANELAKQIGKTVGDVISIAPVEETPQPRGPLNLSEEEEREQGKPKQSPAPSSNMLSTTRQFRVVFRLK